MISLTQSSPPPPPLPCVLIERFISKGEALDEKIWIRQLDLQEKEVCKGQTTFPSADVGNAGITKLFVLAGRLKLSAHCWSPDGFFADGDYHVNNTRQMRRSVDRQVAVANWLFIPAYLMDRLDSILTSRQLKRARKVGRRLFIFIFLCGWWL